MFKLIVLFLLSNGAFAEKPPQDRIVNGSFANIYDFPYQVSLQRDGVHSCGGSIYNNLIIVTAAHCLKGRDKNTMTIRAGSSYASSGGVVIEVANYLYNEKFSNVTIDHDIGVIRLKSPLPRRNLAIKRIALADVDPEDGANAVVSGYGTTAYNSPFIPGYLQYADVNIVSLKRCRSAEFGYGDEVKDTDICAAAPGKDSCQWDSGGPLVSDNVLVGVVSWGDGCADPDYPGIYTSIAKVRSWILTAVNEV